MVPDFLLSLSQVMGHGRNSNSYKFVLARALAEDDLPPGPHIPAAWLADKFLELYWPLATEFRVRQSTDPSKEPVAYKEASLLAGQLGLQPGQSLSEVRRAHPEAVHRLVQRLAARGGCLDEVVPRFSQVKGEPVAAPLFHPADDSRSINLLSDAAEWIAGHRLPMRQLANGAWIRFTETFSAAPRLYKKLAGDTANRKSLAGHRNTLQQIERRCFYCGRADAASTHVDHFLPWSFVLEDRLWNLVLACGGPTGCNQRKRDGIPDDADLQRLIHRNEHFLDIARADPKACHLHFKEWMHRDLQTHVRQLRTAALAEGFPGWSSHPP